MTPDGHYQMGDVVEVPAWWNGDRPTICDVIKDQCYLNAFTNEMVVSTLIDVRPRGLAGAHSRCVNATDILRNVSEGESPPDLVRCSCGVAMKSLADYQVDFHRRAGHSIPEVIDKVAKRV
jgi:hypothetical protein